MLPLAPSGRYEHRSIFTTSAGRAEHDGSGSRWRSLLPYPQRQPEGPSDLYDSGVGGFRFVPGILSLLSHRGGLCAVHRTGIDPSVLFFRSYLAHPVGGLDCTAYSGHGWIDAEAQKYAASASCAMDIADMDVRFRDRCAYLSLCVPDLSARSVSSDAEISHLYYCRSAALLGLRLDIESDRDQAG